MGKRLTVFLLLLVVSGHSCFGLSEENADKHIEVSMRMIGHRILHAVGDSTSLVLPIEKNGDQYVIKFDTEFSFLADVLAPIIDTVIAETGISKNYVVEFATCDSNLIVHSYEVGEVENLLACRGRPLKEECYILYITLLNANSDFSEPMVVNEAETDVGIFGMPWFRFFIILIVVLVGLIIFLISQKSGKNEDPHVIHIGEFLFNKRSLELTFKEDKIELTGKEADLLDLLSSSANETIDRDDILKSVWGDDGDYVGRTLDVFISKLRKKLEADSNVKIINIRGIGYKLVLSE